MHSCYVQEFASTTTLATHYAKYPTCEHHNSVNHPLWSISINLKLLLKFRTSSATCLNFLPVKVINLDANKSYFYYHDRVLTFLEIQIKV